MKKQYVTHFDKNTKHGVILISPRVDKQKIKFHHKFLNQNKKPIYHTNIINRPQETIVLNLISVNTLEQKFTTTKIEQPLKL